MSISIFRQKTYKFLSNFPKITLSRNAKNSNDSRNSQALPVKNDYELLINF